MTIYEIDEAIMECIDAETGDIIDIDRLEALEMARSEKISNVACWIKELKAEAEAIKAEKQALDKRQKSDENKVEQLKKYLDYVLGGDNYEDARCKITHRKSESVELDEGLDVNTLPDELCRIKREASLTAIKEAIKSGTEVAGARIIEKKSILIK